MGQAVPHLKNNVPEAALAVERGLKKATPMVISLVASLANLDKLPEEARKAMQGLGATVRATLVTALSKALIVAEKVVKSRWPKKSNGEAQTSGYAGQASDIKRWSVPTGAKAETHTLHATTGNDNPTGTSGQASNNNNNAPATGTVIYRGAKEVTLDKQLHEWNEQTKDSELKKKIQAAVSHLKEKLNPLVSAIAKAFKNFNAKLEALKKIRDNKDSKPQQITTAESESAAALASLANAQQAAEPALQQQATLVQACEADAAGCFAAGTKLWTPQGYQNVEDLRETDLVYSRNEYDPSGAIEAKPIEKAFRRFAEIVHLHLRGPNGYLVTIRTTGEHPFYAFSKGWMPTKELTSEDWVLTDAGEWAKVEEVFATGEMEVVYNLRVAEWHTYFVGDEGWGWAAWAHNVSCQEVVAEVRAVTGLGSPFANSPAGLAKQIAENMTTYVVDTSNRWRNRNEAIEQLDTLRNVGPATAAKIFWNILLKIGPRNTEAEHNTVLTQERLDLMQKALHNSTRSEQQIRIVLRENSDYRFLGQNTRYYTDSQGRLSRVELVVSNTNTSGPSGNTTWMGELGIAGDYGGHLLGKQYNGMNKYPNLIPMNGRLNSYPYEANTGGGYGRIESVWYAAITHNNAITNASVTLVYGSDKLRPESFDLVFSIDNTEFAISFFNDGRVLSAQQESIINSAMAAAMN